VGAARAFAAAALARTLRACDSRHSSRLLDVSFSDPRTLRLDAETVFLAVVGLRPGAFNGGCGVMGCKGRFVIAGGCQDDVLGARLRDAVPSATGSSCAGAENENGEVGAGGKASSFPKDAGPDACGSSFPSGPPVLPTGLKLVDAVATAGERKWLRQVIGRFRLSCRSNFLREAGFSGLGMLRRMIGDAAAVAAAREEVEAVGAAKRGVERAPIVESASGRMVPSRVPNGAARVFGSGGTGGAASTFFTVARYRDDLAVTQFLQVRIPLHLLRATKQNSRPTPRLGRLFDNPAPLTAPLFRRFFASSSWRLRRACSDNDADCSPALPSLRERPREATPLLSESATEGPAR
jgi:hypothetical protein